MKLCWIIVSLTLFIISLILYLVQGLYNLKFFGFDDDEIITEKTLYEQFSYEVYTSINTQLPMDYIITNGSCPNNYHILNFNLDLDTYFDCRGKYSKELNSNCHNKIINNYTSCFLYDNIKIDYDKIQSIMNIDDRIKHCDYFSRYTQKISTINNQTICVKSDGRTYKDLLYYSVYILDENNEKNNCPTGYKICGILDTKKNILCLKETENCPLTNINIDNNKKLILSNNTNLRTLITIEISENKPLSHVWDIMIRDSNEIISQENLDKRKNLAKKDFKLIDEGDDYSFEILYKDKNLNVEDISNYNILKVNNISKYNLKQNLNIYGRSYIGFKNIDELEKFEKTFNPDDHRDNPLYKISTNGHHPLVTISFSCVFLILSNIFLILFLVKDMEIKTIKSIIIIFIFIIFLFLIGEIIIIGRHFDKFPRIIIEMDRRMEFVLDKYNARTILSQLFRIIGSGFNFFALIFIFISLFYFK